MTASVSPQHYDFLTNGPTLAEDPLLKLQGVKVVTHANADAKDGRAFRMRVRIDRPKLVLPCQEAALRFAM